MNAANILETPGADLDEKSNDDNLSQTAAETALSKYTAFGDGIKEELHSCYHSNKQCNFQQFAILLKFTLDEITFLKLFIETRHSKLGCTQCDGGNHKKPEEYKRIEQETCDKINTYFNETISNIIHQHHQHILKQYETKSNEKFYQLQSKKPSNLQIKFKKSMINELNVLLTDCYTIIDVDSPKPPTIKIKYGTLYDDEVKICIIDQDKAINDKYEILLNNKILIIFDSIKNEEDHELDITNYIKPLIKYSISIRRHIKYKNEWSEYCEPINIERKFKCVWSEKYHGKNLYFTGNNKYIVCKSNYGDCTILCDRKYVITSRIFKQIAFYFKIEEIAQHSYFGFMEHSAINTIKNWDILINKSVYSYCLSCCNQSYEIKRYIKGQSKGTKKWTGWSSAIHLNHGKQIKNGDTFIFIINFDEMYCNVFINKIKNENKVSVNLNEHTFDNIPHQIIPFYCHQHSQYSGAHSKVLVSIYDTDYEYILR